MTKNKIELVGGTTAQPSHFSGVAVHSAEGRVIGVVETRQSALVPASADCLVVLLTGGDRRALPKSLLAFDRERSCYVCDAGEAVVRSSPEATGHVHLMPAAWFETVARHFRAPNTTKAA